MGNTSSNIHTVSSLKTWINCSILKHNDSLKQKVFYERMLSKYPVYWIQPTKLNLLTYAPSITASFLTHPSGCLSVCMHSVAQLCWVFCTYVVQWVWWVFFFVGLVIGHRKDSVSVYLPTLLKGLETTVFLNVVPFFHDNLIYGSVMVYAELILLKSVAFRTWFAF